MAVTLLDLIEPRGFWEDRKTAFVFWDGASPALGLGKLSYRALKKKAEKFSFELLKTGVLPGDRVAIMLPNMLQLLIVYFGVLMAGAVAVPINPRYNEAPNEISKILKDSGAKVAVTLDRFYSAIKSAGEETDLRCIMLTTPANSLPLFKKLAYLARAWWQGENFYGSRSAKPKTVKYKKDIVVRPDDLALIIYTSGTTGAPKGVAHTHRSLLENAKACRKYVLEMGLKENEEIFLAAVPYFHILGLAALLHAPLLLRAKTVLIPDPRKINKILEAIDFAKATAFAGMPGHYEVMARTLSQSAKQRDFSSVKLWINGGAKLHKIHRDKFEKIVGGKIRNGYGMSELGIVSCQKSDDGEEDSVGEPLAGVETAIYNPENGIGELWVRSNGQMAGYWRQPEATAEAVNPDGWLYTGDFAKYSDKISVPRLILKGRKKYLIKTRAGENIDPAEIEKTLMTNPYVTEAAVVGVEDERHGERIRACVVLRDPQTSCSASQKEKIFEHCKKQLPSFKVPNEIICVKEIEKNAVGKVLYEKLKELKASS